MKNTSKLLNNMATLGYPLMEPNERVDASDTLADVVRSKNPRYWEGFPVLLANAMEEFDFSPVEGEKSLTRKKDQENYRTLLLLSGLVFEEFNFSSSWWPKFKRGLSAADTTRLKQLTNAFAQGKELKWDGNEVDAERLKRTFELYFENRAIQNDRLQQRTEELSLEYSLSKIFSPKQKELFRKKLSGQPMNKTEKEYYSRVVKKKVLALANPQVHRLARSLLEK